MEIWEPKSPGIFWATPGLLRDCFTLPLPYFYIQFHFHPYLPHFAPISPTFQGTSTSPAPSLKFGNTLIVTTKKLLPAHTAYEDGTYKFFRNVGPRGIAPKKYNIQNWAED
jgi:hypothetical protein